MQVSVAALERAAELQAGWVRRAIYWHQVRRSSHADCLAHCMLIAWLIACCAICWHQVRQPPGATRLRVQPGVTCLSAVAGGKPALDALRQQLEAICSSSPPLLLSIGQTIPRTWSYAVSMLRAMRDGRDPVAAARHAAAALEAGPRNGPHKQPIAPAAMEARRRPYVPFAEARHCWLTAVAPALRVAADSRVLADALQLLINQGELFASCGIIYLHPDYVTRLLKPLVDHRVSREWAIPRAYEHTGELLEDAPSVRLLLAAVEVLTGSGELREELLPMLWEDTGLHVDDYGEVLLMLSESGVLFLSEFTTLGRRWVMPMRLPERKPESVEASWRSARDGAQLSVTYALGKIAPPGLAERLMAACFGLGVYHQFWRKGALIRTSFAAAAGVATSPAADAFVASPEPMALLLIELETTTSNAASDSAALALSGHAAADAAASGYDLFGSMSGGYGLPNMGEPPSGTAAASEHTLACTVRGPPERVDELTELLAQVRLLMTIDDQC